MNVYDRFLEMLDSAIEEYGNANKLAEALDVNVNLLTRWRNRERVPSLKSIQPLIDLMSERGFLFKQGQTTIKRLGDNAPIENIELTEGKGVPVYEVAGAGPGILFNELEPLFNVMAPPDYSWHADYAVYVRGHSMEPLIPNGAIVGIKEDEPFQANEIYLANIPYEGLVIKRVGVNHAKHEFVFKSQNPDKDAYPDFTVGINENEKIVIGRVVWFMVRY